jgi:hypothetical protein
MARPLDDDLPDDRALWRWVWASVRPVLGYVLVGAGLLLLLAGYLGVSREVLVAKQLPYLVSGGLFGLAAVTLGSRIMLIEDLRRDTSRLDRLEQAVVELHGALLTRADAPGTQPTPYPATNGREAPADLLALTGGASFHRADCPMVQGKSSAEPLTAGAAQQRGLKACRMCQPLVAGV